MISLYISLGIFALAALLVYIFKKQVVCWLLKLKSKCMLHGLREAIHEADADKAKTNKKNVVIYNSTKNQFEPVHKAAMKRLANSTKNKSNRKQTAGAKKAKGKRALSFDRVKHIEDKSLYVTN